MKTKKTREELERIVREDKMFFLFILVLMIILVICMGVFFSQKSRLETQLSECQEQVPKISYSCSIEGHWLEIVSEDKNHHHSFNLVYYGYDELQERLLDYDLRISDCEVIE